MNHSVSAMDFQILFTRDMAPDRELAKKHRARKTKTTEVIKDKGNHFSFLKKPNVHSVCLRR